MKSVSKFELTHGFWMLTCVFAWLHLDLYLGSKNSNSFHWTKFWYVMLHSKVVRNIPGMVWVHSLNYIIIYDEGRKNASCTVQRFWCRFKKSRSFLFKCCFFFVNIRIWQNDAMVSIHIIFLKTVTFIIAHWTHILLPRRKTWNLFC